MAVLVLAAVLFAGWRTRHQASLFAYFCVQAAYVPVIWGVERFSGDTSLEYLTAYAVMTGLILTCVVWIASEGLSYRSAGFASVLALTVARMAYVSLGHPAKGYEWVQLTEAGILLWAALCVGGRAPYVRNGAVSLVLALLWLAQAFFRLGFILHLESWLPYNWRVPPILGIVAFLIVGGLAHEVPTMRQGHPQGAGSHEGRRSFSLRGMRG